MSNGMPVNTTYFAAFNAGGSDGIHGYTFFVPNDAALSAAASTLATFAGNMTTIHTKSLHPTGTSIYSPSLRDGSPSYTSAAGEELSLTTNSTGTFVQSGNSQARVSRTDVLLVNNGVIHVIDAVLLTQAHDSGAASSAYVSATSEARQTSTETGPIGSPTSTSSSRNGDVTFGLSAGHTMVVIGVVAGTLLA